MAKPKRARQRSLKPDSSEKSLSVVTKTLEYLAQHLSEPLPASRLAQHTGYSDSRFRAIIRTTTGKSYLLHVAGMRIEKAQRLLSETQMGILDIAFEVGYNSHEQFCRVFKKKTGHSPSAFRSSSRKTENLSETFSAEKPLTDPKEWLVQKFQGEDISGNWAVSTGRTEHQKDASEGIIDDAFWLLCSRPLPESFEVRMEVQFQRGGGISPTEFFLKIQNETNSESCYEAAYNQQVCLLRYLNLDRRICENPPIRPNAWNNVRVRFVDDTIYVYLEETLLFEYRSDFPVPYHQRSRLALGAWRCRARLRNFILTDLGFPSLVRPTRQGDTLFNAGLFDAARSFYERILDSRTTFADTMELCYKIGRCHVAAESFGQAQVWLEKVVSLPVSDFWARQARLQKLHIDLVDQRESATGDVLRLFANPLLRDEARVLISLVVQRFEQEGRFQACLSLCELLVNVEEKNSLALLNAQRQSIESLLWLERYLEAESLLGSFVASTKFSNTSPIGELDDLGYALTMQGRFVESEECYARIRELAHDPYTRANTIIHGSRNLRGQGMMDKALDMLEQVHTAFESLTYSRAYASLEQAHILCGCNKPEEAQSAMKRAEELHPSIGLLSAGSGSTYKYVPLLLLEKFDEAAQMLETDSRTEAGWIFVRAAHLLKASFLWYLAGNESKAKKALEEIVRRFPERRCHAMADLATNLLHGKWESVKELPSSSYHRSEVFYLAALVLEKQGQGALSHELMQMSTTEDLSLRWPAFLAKKKLSGSREE